MLIPRFLPALVLGIVVAISATSPSLADPITYTLQFIGTGTLGSSLFNNAEVTLQFVGDTDNIINVSGFYVNEMGTASVSVMGVNGGALVMFTDPIAVFSNPSADLGPVTVGFTDLNSVDIVDDQNSFFHWLRPRPYRADRWRHPYPRGFDLPDRRGGLQPHGRHLR